MTGEPGVSFLVPVHNKISHLQQVIDGLRAQQGAFEREFVFVDDGSADGSAQALAELTAGWPAARILRQLNRGPSVATNRAIAAAKFPMLKLVDGDDVLLPHATSVLLDLLARHSSAVLAYGRTEQYGSAADASQRLHDDVRPAARSAARVGTVLGAMLRQSDLGPTNCLVRAAAVRQAGGCDERVFTQDYSLLLRLAALGPFVGTDAVLALTPAIAADRINDGGPQVPHDLNLTLLHFLSEHRVPTGLQRRAVRHAVTRAWLWAHRHEGAGLISYWSALRLCSCLPIAGLRLPLLRRSCAAFTLSRGVRRSAPA